jgi:3-phosphoshikimate 1-carboxyvinyltransferase
VKLLPDILEIQPLAKPPECTITVPGSKSITNRALILAALSDHKCTLSGALWADDTQVMVDALWELDFEVEVKSDPTEECNRTITVAGRGGRIPAKKADLYVGNAGTAARFLTTLVCLGHGEYTIAGDARMHERPMGDLFDTLRSLNVQIESNGPHLPATIHANGLRRKSRVQTPTQHSTQFVSALLLISKVAPIEVELAAAGDPNGYIEMTQRMLQEFYPDYRIEPDLSGASCFLATEHLTGGKIDIADWPGNSLQVDGKFPQVLKSRPTEVSRSRDLGDSVMTLAICALFGDQPLKLVDAQRMREQECDRLHAMVTELQRVGAKAEEHDEGFTVWPAEPGQLHGADIETYNDHRMAMCFAVLGLKVPGIRIKNPSCVSKTFPNFFEKLEQLRQ